MLKIAIATIVSAVIMVLGYHQGTFIWVGAAVLCAILETTIFKNTMLLVPSAAAGAGALTLYLTGDAQTAVIASFVMGAVMIQLLFKELTHDKEAEEKAKQANMRKTRGHQY